MFRVTEWVTGRQGWNSSLDGFLWLLSLASWSFPSGLVHSLASGPWPLTGEASPAIPIVVPVLWLRMAGALLFQVTCLLS